MALQIIYNIRKKKKRETPYWGNAHSVQRECELNKGKMLNSDKLKKKYFTKKRLLQLLAPDQFYK